MGSKTSERTTPLNCLSVLLFVRKKQLFPMIKQFSFMYNSNQNVHFNTITQIKMFTAPPYQNFIQIRRELITTMNTDFCFLLT